VKSRLILILAIFVLWGGAIAWRLVELQIRQHETYRDVARSQQNRVVELQAPRGTIFDTRGRKLAMSVEVESAFADPLRIEDAAVAARRLSEVLNVDRGRLEERLSQDREFVWLGRLLDPATAEAVRRLGLEGVGFLQESKRVYPLGRLAAQLIGFAGIDQNGLEGLEQGWDKVVAGKPVQRKVLRDARRSTVLSPAFSFRDAKPGRDLHLTIDASIQHMLEQELAAALRERRAKQATGVILDPASGAVLAMASLPSFDPNRFQDYPPERRRNRVITDVFEPGSTFKIVTAAAALEANLIDPADLVDCEMGGITLAGTHISDHRPFGLLTFGEVIAKSSNVGAIKAGLMVGSGALYSQIRSFRLDEPTGIDLPGESSGILRPVERWQSLDSAYISFGQGISVTALQLAGAFAAVANGGKLFQPYVVERVGANGSPERSLHTRPTLLAEPISPATARTIGRMLEAVVSEGTGRQARVQGYSVAGKTGTAQKAVAGRGYAAGRYLSSFVGYAPSRAPAVVLMVAIDEPQVGYHGGDVAAPVFARIMSQILIYLGVGPDRTTPQRWPGQRLEEPLGVPTGRAVFAARPILPEASAAADGVPDLRGLTARQAVVRSATLGFAVGLHGQGFVARQSPAAGTPLKSASERIDVWLARSDMQ
jgi:cell division protein FtsI (penicillin-binding protein 3)